MKRPHRRFHLLIWLLMGTAAAAGLMLALGARPADPLRGLPAALADKER